LVVDGDVSITSTGALTLPVGTTDQQPTTGVKGMVRFNSSSTRLQFYNGNAWRSIETNIASGGAVTEHESYRIHTFTISDTFTVSIGCDVSYLIVAGGGGGANGDDVNGASGGGGAGGMIEGGATFTAGSYRIIVGSGGRGVTQEYGPQTAISGNYYSYSIRAHTNGSDTKIESYTNSFTVDVSGGGMGNGGDGGSGGGEWRTAGVGLGTSGQGNNGGQSGYSGGYGGGGGGGGAGAAGGAGGHARSGAHSYGGNGGIGKQSSITGTTIYYAGGGGGGAQFDPGYGSGYDGRSLGGRGGGGSGGGDALLYQFEGLDGTDGLGGGGGGSSSGVRRTNIGPYRDNLITGKGGDGIVIIRYPI
jgi:hypothetical protein